MTEPTAQVTPSEPSAWNIANALTVLRLFLVPVFGWLLLTDGGQQAAYRWWAFGAFFVAMLTDARGDWSPTSARWPTRSRTRPWSPWP